MIENVYKVIIIGDCSVGKTSICRSLTDKPIDQRYESTIGAAFNTLTIEQSEMDTKYKFHIWDTAGQERFHSLLPLYFRDAPICIIVYDISNRESFNKINYWYKLYKSHNTTETSILYLIGNKVDLRKKIDRCVSREEGEEKAKYIDAFYDETSALENNTIHVFDNISTMIAGVPKYDNIKMIRSDIIQNKVYRDGCKCII